MNRGDLLRAVAGVALTPLARWIPPAPRLKTGGYVRRTGLARVHAGETFSGCNIVLRMDGQLLGRITLAEVVRPGRNNAAALPPTSEASD